MKTKRFFGLMLMLVVSLAITSCSDDDDDPGDPNTSVPDPEGTVTLKMRNTDNGGTRIPNTNIYIDEGNNFGGADFVSLGAMKGLGNVVRIPTEGWSNMVAVKPGCGYVARVYGSTYVRIYVMGYTMSTEGGIIGAEIKYQMPFEPTQLEISGTLLVFSASGSAQTITVSTNAEDWTARSVPEWCHPVRDGKKLIISVDENKSIAVREGVVYVMAGEKNTEIKVRQNGVTTSAPYKIGDLFSENGVVGIVYKVTDGGQHGMIVSLDQKYTSWGAYVESYANDLNNGINNLNKIKELYPGTSWERDGKNAYEAFSWCDDKNNGSEPGWYLPAINELKELYAGYCGLSSYPGEEANASTKYMAARNAFDAKLLDNGGQKISISNHWSSTEKDLNNAYRIDLSNGRIKTEWKIGNSVRAVHKF